MLIIAGDICPHFDRVAGSPKDVAGQFNWLSTTFREWHAALRVKWTVAVWGNHDFVGKYWDDEMAAAANIPWVLLQDSAADVDGVRLWGTPYTPTFYNWAFMEDESQLVKRFGAIPEELDILVSHGPPMWCCDRAYGAEHVGSKALYGQLMGLDVPPKHIICGHIHAGRGTGRVMHEPRPVEVWNVAAVDDRYIPHNPMWTEVILEEGQNELIQ